MAIEKCTECKGDVSSNADACPHCGYNIKKEKESKAQGIGCLVLIVLAIGFWFWLPSSEPGPIVPWQDKDHSSTAYYHTENWVKDRLVSPSTAKFPSRSERSNHVRRTEGQKYTIISYVDSQNRMGAMIRSTFVAEVEQVSENTWRLLSLDIQ